MTARVVYAYGIHAYDSATPVKMHWRCSCGGDGVNIPGDTSVCSGCSETVRIPEEPIDLTASSTEPAASAPQPTSTAWKLAAYRSELQACGFSPNDVRTLVLIAARNTTEWTVGPLFLARAEPPAPIVRIENYQPGSPEDLAIRKRFGLDEGDRD